jgi:hypothetical protein
VKLRLEVSVMCMYVCIIVKVYVTVPTALGSTQPLNRNEYQEYFLGVKAAGV